MGFGGLRANLVVGLGGSEWEQRSRVPCRPCARRKSRQRRRVHAAVGLGTTGGSKTRWGLGPVKALVQRWLGPQDRVRDSARWHLDDACKHTGVGETAMVAPAAGERRTRGRAGGIDAGLCLRGLVSLAARQSLGPMVRAAFAQRRPRACRARDARVRARLRWFPGDAYGLSWGLCRGCDHEGLRRTCS